VGQHAKTGCAALALPIAGRYDAEFSFEGLKCTDKYFLLRNKSSEFNPCAREGRDKTHG
jgi:hypothetical protein